MPNEETERNSIRLPQFARRIDQVTSWLPRGLTEEPEDSVGVVKPFTGVLDTRVQPGGWVSPSLSYLTLRPLITQAIADRRSQLSAELKPASMVDPASTADPASTDDNRSTPAEREKAEGGERKVYQILQDEPERRPASLDGQETPAVFTNSLDPATVIDRLTETDGPSNTPSTVTDDTSVHALDIVRHRLVPNGAEARSITVGNESRTDEAQRGIGGSGNESRPSQSSLTPLARSDPDGPVREPKTVQSSDTFSAPENRSVERDDGQSRDPGGVNGSRPDLTVTSDSVSEIIDAPSELSSPRGRTPNSSLADRRSDHFTRTDPPLTVEHRPQNDEAERGDEFSADRSERGASNASDSVETGSNAPDAPDIADVSSTAANQPAFEDMVNIDRLTDRLYGKLERKLRVERERRGR